MGAHSTSTSLEWPPVVRTSDGVTVPFSSDNTVHHAIFIMRTSVQRYGLILFPLTLLHSIHVLAQRHIGLPHEVFNVTQPVTVSEPSIATYTTTEVVTTTPQVAAPTSTSTIYSIVFPSPDASPIEVTAQSQVLTSYVPLMTWCVGPPIGFSAITGAPYQNATTTNYTTIIEGTGRCETVYAPMTTTVCATTLTGLASKVTITDCDQEVTFSTEYGFNLETPTPITRSESIITPGPSVRRSLTYWLAPWQSLTAGETPSDVDVKICNVLDDGNLECSRSQEVWEVVMVTTTTTSPRSIEFTATISGPGTLIIETVEAFITDTISTIGLSTTLLLETEVATESTSTGRKSPTDSLPTVHLTSTHFFTKTVVHKPTSTSEPDSTTTVFLTSFVTSVGTTTITRSRSQSNSSMVAG